MNNSSRSVNILSYKISRLGRKLQFTNDPKILGALPKDIPERTWAETLQKEDNDLVIFEMREEIFEAAMRYCYDKYMVKQTTAFSVHCASLAWLKLIDWYFYRHDPGEDPSAYPPCYIPKRAASWAPDPLPAPSPKDTICDHSLPVDQEHLEPVLRRWASNDSLDYPVVKCIPEDCKFPGRVQQFVDEGISEMPDESWLEVGTLGSTSQDHVDADSELVQKVTDYSTELSPASTKESGPRRASKMDGSMQGAGDSLINSRAAKPGRKPSRADRSKKLLKQSSSKLKTKSALDVVQRSPVSLISDCRLRSLRLDTQFEIAEEKMDSSPGDSSKRQRR